MGPLDVVTDRIAAGSYVPTDLLDITVLMGGPGSEREVSLVSGRAVADALARAGHRVTAADITPDDTSALDRDGADAVFIALHGAFGEDGQVQQLCEDRGIAYVGSGPVASKLAMDKHASKLLFRDAGLLTPEWATFETGGAQASQADPLGKFPPPCVLKPVDGGSSVDITIARDPAARGRALGELLATYGRAMVETYIPGREMTVGILADQPLPLVEIVPAQEFYDYFAKYEDEGTEYITDPELPADVAQRLQADALRAHECLGCRDFSRVDFLLADDGRAYVLEVNTIPGFTGHSLLPKAAAAAGVSFEALCDRLVRLSLDRAGAN